jgi:hypothetical protein
MAGGSEFDRERTAMTAIEIDDVKDAVGARAQGSWMAEGLSTLRTEIGPLASRGAIAGLVAGTGFLLANMWYAYENGLPGIAPFLAFSTIFNGSAAPILTPAAIPIELGEGLVLHVAFSLGFGIGFALLVPFLRKWPALVVGAIGYGLAVFVLNFEILGRTVFPFFTNPTGPDNVFEGFVHPLIFGVLLIPFFLGRTARSRRAAA